MRLHRLTLTGVGPFKQTQDIDVDDLSASGLFLIEGPTGSGKTTIIDAVVYALYGVASSGDEEATRMRIRSHFCGETDPTGVRCEFSVDGRRYVISRVPAGCRDPEEPDRAAKSRGPRQVLTEHVDGGEPTVRTNRKEVGERVAQILGMSVEQFRQLVVLPQGRFSELLRQTPAERLRSLEPLLEDGLMARVQADLEQRGRDARAQRARADAAVDAAMNQLQGRLRAWLAQMPPEVDFSAPDLTHEVRHSRVADILAALDAEADRAVVAREEQAVVAEALRLAARSAAEALEVVAALDDARSRLDRARRAAHPDDAALDEAEAEDRRSDLTRLVGTLETHAAWELLATARAEDRAVLAGESTGLMVRITELEEEAAPLPEQAERLARELVDASLLAGNLDTARAEAERLGALLAKAHELERMAAELEQLQRAVRDATDLQSVAEEQETALEAQWSDLVHRQRAESAIALAATLASGAACPVCGSTEHPAPAVAGGAAAPVSDDEVAAAEAGLAQARARVTSARSTAEKASDRHGQRAQALAALSGAVGDHGVDRIEADLQQAEARLASAHGAASEKAALEEAIASARERQGAIGRELADSRTRVAEIGATIAAQEGEERKRAAQIRELIGQAESATVLLADTQARVMVLGDLVRAWQGLGVALARVPAELADASIEAVRAGAEERTRVSREADALLDSFTEAAARAVALRDEAGPLADDLHEAIMIRNEVHASTVAPLQLAALVSADNRLRLQLRSYALQRRFETVLVAASGHLERMSAGRFSFALSEDAAGSGQSGLGITLLDSWTGHEQDPKSLSGGETFYASLSLALGLADVVRGEAGGSTLETLFVDEGFGSLDQDTLAQVLDQLDSLRAGNRVVGVISHVTEMRESIPDRLEVRRQDDRTSLLRRSPA